MDRENLWGFKLVVPFRNCMLEHTWPGSGKNIVSLTLQDGVVDFK